MSGLIVLAGFDLPILAVALVIGLAAARWAFTQPRKPQDPPPS
jgi:hypothetical protein